MPTTTKPKRPQPKPWEPWEDNILRTKYRTNTAQQLHDNYLPDRNEDSIYHRLQRLNLVTPRKQARAKPWSDKEKETLIREYQTHSVSELQKQFFPNRTVESISNQITRLGCRKTERRPTVDKTKKRNLTPWTPDEIETLKKNFEKLSRKELGQLLPGKTNGQISHKITSLGIAEKPYTHWTPEENQIFEENYAEHTIEELQALLPKKSITNIKTKLRNTRKPRKNGHDITPKVHWSSAELALLTSNAPKCTIDQLHAMLPDRTKQSIRSQLIRMEMPYIKTPSGRKRKS